MYLVEIEHWGNNIHCLQVEEHKFDKFNDASKFIEKYENLDSKEYKVCIMKINEEEDKNES